jgi:hypothetical protein
MKRIELTEEQLNKFLEMCNVLFPEYSQVMEDDFPGIFWFYKNKNDGTAIHWFEFCIRHLVDEIAWKNIQTNILADCEYEDKRTELIRELFKDRIFPGMYHPVDYLYEEFLKLKK